MKFYTLQAYDECYRDGRTESFFEARDRYHAHLTSLKGVIPDRILELALLKGTSDGLLVKANHDFDKYILKLSLRGGYTEIGYYDLELTYRGASLDPGDEATLKKVAESTKSRHYQGCDLSFHELDLAPDGLIEHNFLFHSMEEDRVTFKILSKSLDWRVIPRKSQRLAFLENRYVSSCHPSSPHPE